MATNEWFDWLSSNGASFRHPEPQRRIWSQPRIVSLRGPRFFTSGFRMTGLGASLIAVLGSSCGHNFAHHERNELM
jgi:hypothetical protein